MLYANLLGIIIGIRTSIFYTFNVKSEKALEGVKGIKEEL